MSRVEKGIYLTIGKSYLIALRTIGIIHATVKSLLGDFIVVEMNGYIEELNKDDIYFYSEVQSVEEFNREIVSYSI